MKASATTIRPVSAAAWMRLALGLVVAAFMAFQGGVARGHTHDPALIASAPAHAVYIAVDDGQPAVPLPADHETQCPLCHAPFHHGGIVLPSDAALQRIALADAPARPGAELDPITARGPPSPPARGPPSLI